MQFENKNFFVYGMSKSGVAVSKLIKNMRGNVYFYDDNILYNDKLNYIQCGYNFIHKDNIYATLQNIYCAVISPGICLENPIVQMCISMGIYITNEIELANSLFFAPIIAVTGTNGKSTTCALIHNILSVSGESSHLLGNFGEPLSTCALQIDRDDIVTLEISSYQLELAKTVIPHIAIFTNIAPDHLSRHASMDNYFAIKSSMFLRQGLGEISILNADCERVKNLGELLTSNTYYFSREKEVRGCYILDDKIFFQDGKDAEYIMNINDIKLLGEHNLENVLCSILATKLFGCSVRDIVKAVKSFEGLEHRLEFVRQIDGVFYINDSKATNISSTLSAIHSVQNHTVIILGGSDKGEDFSTLFSAFGENISQAVLYGDTRYKLLQGATAAGYNNIVVCQSLKEAVCAAKIYAMEGGNVLFSPACPSFDSYKNFEERGRDFKSIVGAL